jgi:hypothetical protein
MDGPALYQSRHSCKMAEYPWKWLSMICKSGYVISFRVFSVAWYVFVWLKFYRPLWLKGPISHVHIPLVAYRMFQIFCNLFSHYAHTRESRMECLKVYWISGKIKVRCIKLLTKKDLSITELYIGTIQGLGYYNPHTMKPHRVWIFVDLRQISVLMHVPTFR